AVTWRAGDRVLCEAPASADGATTCEAAFDADAQIVLEARDPDGAVGSDAITVEVANAAPTARILAPEAGDAFEPGVPVAFTAVVDDAEDAPDALTVAWSDGGGAPLDLDDTPAADGALEGAATFAPGAHAVTLTVTDTDGLSATA